MPESIPASLVIDTLKDTFRDARAGAHREPLGWVLSVPDTHQRTVPAALDKERALRVLTCATEDEATAIGAGLFIGGEPCMLMIQHAGLYSLDQHPARRGHGRPGPALLHDRAPEPREGQGPAVVTRSH